MTENKKEVLSPSGVLKSALWKWYQNAVAIVAIYSLTILLTQALKFYLMISRVFYIRLGEWAASVFSTVMCAGVFFVNTFISLIVIQYFLNPGASSMPFDRAFDGARQKFSDYFKSFLLYVAIVFTLIGAGVFFFVFGGMYFGPHAPGGVKMPALLLTSTVTVVLLIASVWYAFFFSLAPLISALEHKGAGLSLQLSKSRIKKYPWRYLLTLLSAIILYFAVGMLFYVFIAVLIKAKNLLAWIDPVTMVLWAPLWFGVWVFSYQKLTEIKGKNI